MLGKSAVLGSEKSLIIPSQNPGLQGKHLKVWKVGFSAADFGENTELLPSVPGDAPGKKKIR